MFGMPDRLISDNGTTFKSCEFEEFLKLCGIVHHCSSVYYPQVNGAVERMHSTLKSRIGKMKLSNPDVSFERRLQKALYDMRGTFNESTGETPVKRFLGREMRSLLAVHTKLVKVPARSLSERYARKKGGSREYEVGQKIYTRRGRGSGYDQEAEVLERLGGSTYRVMFPGGRSVVYNKTNMKPRWKEEERTMEHLETAYDAVRIGPRRMSIGTTPDEVEEALQRVPPRAPVAPEAMSSENGRRTSGRNGGDTGRLQHPRRTRKKPQYLEDYELY